METVLAAFILACSQFNYSAISTNSYKFNQSKSECIQRVTTCMHKSDLANSYKYEKCAKEVHL